VLLLISPDFMDSDYCSEVELKSALERHDQGLSRVVPILLRPTDWETSDIAKLQSFPTDAKPITTWSNEDEAFKNIAQGIRKIVKELQEARPVDSVSLPGSAEEHVEAEKRKTLRELARRHRRVFLAAVFVLLAVAGVSYAWSKSNALATEAESWLDIGSYRNALADFQLASRWNPLSRRAKNGVQMSNIALSRSDEVEFRLGIAVLLRSIPDDPRVRLLAGDLAFHENRAGDALNEYERASRARPSFSEAYFRAGIVLLHRGSIKDAKEALERAMNANPAAAAVPRYSNALAFCLAKLGRLDEALTIYGRNSNYPLSAIEASRLLMIRGEVKQARDLIQRAVNWLNDEKIAALPDNQGPWEFEAGNQGVRLTGHSEKICYAQIALAAATFLLGNENLASDTAKRAPCSGVVQDAIDIVKWDLETIRKANGSLAKQIQAFETRILEALS
jgi:tetratricopeptide (TPR) repeat protein